MEEARLRFVWHTSFTNCRKIDLILRVFFFMLLNTTHYYPFRSHRPTRDLKRKYSEKKSLWWISPCKLIKLSRHKYWLKTCSMLQCTPTFGCTHLLVELSRNNSNWLEKTLKRPYFEYIHVHTVAQIIWLNILCGSLWK